MTGQNPDRSLGISPVPASDIPVDDIGTELREFRLAAREAARAGSVTVVRDPDGTVIARIVPVPAPSGRPESLAGYLPTKAQQLTCALQEHRDVVAAEIARHLSNVRSEAARHEEALARYDAVFDLRLTGATRENPSGTASTEGTPAS
jgi:hypothetical protein